MTFLGFYLLTHTCVTLFCSYSDLAILINSLYIPRVPFTRSADTIFFACSHYTKPATKWALTYTCRCSTDASFDRLAHSYKVNWISRFHKYSLNTTFRLFRCWVDHRNLMFTEVWTYIFYIRGVMHSISSSSYRHRLKCFVCLLFFKRFISRTTCSSTCCMYLQRGTYGVQRII